MKDETESSTKAANDNNKREGELDDSASSTDLGTYSSWMSLPIEARNSRLSNINEIFNELSESEAEIRRRILSYKNESEELTNRLVVTRLIRDQYRSSYICTTNWGRTDALGRRYTATYSFLTLLKTEKNKPVEEELIFDLNFKSQFTLSQPTPRYETMWSYLPNIFVGTRKKLRRIISIICSNMDEPIPPLMKQDYLINKWLYPGYKLHHF